jgi:thioredoxin reductase (NADPH)
MSNQENKIENVVIIGSGPAGLTAALYTSRAALKPLVVEGSPPGGQLLETTEVENFPGYPKPVKGYDLVNDIRAQATTFGTRFASGEVAKFELEKNPKVLTLSDNTQIKAHAVILATGANARYMGLENEQKLKGYGVSACAVCDGFFYKEQDVCVVGGGDSALEDALFLTSHAKSIKVIHRRDELRASKILQERAMEAPKIEFIWDSVVTDVLGERNTGGVNGVKVKNVKTEKETILPVTGIFVAIGHDPNTKLFADSVELDNKRFIVTKGKSTKTNIPGVFAAGDVMDPVYQQAVTAAGTGCMSALDCEKWLIENKH